MARGYQPSIPLTTNSLFGPYVLTKTFNKNAQQNLKMIILTEKGEKLTDVNFGCGLKRFLFESKSSFNKDAIKSEILFQIGTHASYIGVDDILIDAKENMVAIQINYTILPTKTSVEDLFEVTS